MSGRVRKLIGFLLAAFQLTAGIALHNNAELWLSATIGETIQSANSEAASTLIDGHKRTRSVESTQADQISGLGFLPGAFAFIVCAGIAGSPPSAWTCGAVSSLPGRAPPQLA